MTMIDERLAEVDRRIDDLEAGMGLRRSDQQQSVRRHVDALRQEQANAQAAARGTPDPVGERLSRLRSRLEVAERSIDADLAQDRPQFTAAVEAELRGWDAFAERLQATAAAKTGTARDRAETGIKELRRRRLAVTERLDDLRHAPRRLGGSTKSASPPRAMSWNGWRTTYRHHSTKGGTPMNLVSQTTKRIRWTIGINGALSVAFGAMILAWPGISLYALTILFGAYALAGGVVGLVNTSRVNEGRGWMALFERAWHRGRPRRLGVAEHLRSRPAVRDRCLRNRVWRDRDGRRLLASNRSWGRCAVLERARLRPVRPRDVREAGRGRARPTRPDRCVLARQGHHRAGGGDRRGTHHESRVPTPTGATT